MIDCLYETVVPSSNSVEPVTLNSFSCPSLPPELDPDKPVVAEISMLPERGNKDSKMVKDEDLDETNDSDESSKSDNSSSNGTSSSKSSSESSSSEELRPPSTVLLSEEKVLSPSKDPDSSISNSSHSRSSSGPGTISESAKSSGIEEAEPDVVSISKNDEEAELAHSSSASLSDSSASDDYGFQADANESKLLSTSDTEDEYGFSSQLLNEDANRISVEEAEGEDGNTENMGGLFHNSGIGRSTPTFILPLKSEEDETNRYDKYKNYLSSHTTPEKRWARDFVFKQKTPEKVEDLIEQVGSKDENSDFEGSNESERVEDPRDSLDNESDSKADDVLASSSGNKASDDVEQVSNDEKYRKREKSNPALIKYLDEDNLARAMFVDDENISKESTGKPKPSTKLPHLSGSMYLARATSHAMHEAHVLHGHLGLVVLNRITSKINLRHRKMNSRAQPQHASRKVFC